MKHSSKLRTILIDGVTYRWRTKSGRNETATFSKYLETLTVYRDDYKRSPLKVWFNVEQSIQIAGGPGEPHWEIGYPHQGVAWKTDSPTKSVNLNRPGVVAVIIGYALSKNWDAPCATGEMLIEDGFSWLEQLEFPA